MLPETAGSGTLATLAVTGEPFLELLGGFILALREAGLPVSLTENLDAMEAVGHIPLEDRDAFKYALAATLVKNHSHWRVFETVFEVYFSHRGSAHVLYEDAAAALAELEDQMDLPPGEGATGAGGAGGEAMTPEELAEALYQSLLKGNDAQMRAVARQAVRRYAGMEPGRPVGGTYYLYRTLRQLDLDGVLAKLLEAAKDAAPEDQNSLDARLEADEYEHRINQLKSEIEAEIRRGLVADRGVEAMSRTLRKPLPEDIDFMHASRDELKVLRQAIQPLTRKLAVRLARKRRRGRRGPLDFRSTVRHSLSTGGVPADPQFRPPRPHKPEIFVIADISGSVAAFARFTLHLVYALSGQFSRVRSFVFIDGIDEVTHMFGPDADLAVAIQRITLEAKVFTRDGHSDYGHAFVSFTENFPGVLSPRSSLLILGDGRTNYRNPEADVLAHMVTASRHAHWLNPEPQHLWGSGDYVGRWLWAASDDTRPAPLQVDAARYDGAVQQGRDSQGRAWKDGCIGADAHTHYFELEQRLVAEELLLLVGG